MPTTHSKLRGIEVLDTRPSLVYQGAEQLGTHKDLIVFLLGSRIGLRARLILMVQANVAIIPGYAAIRAQIVAVGNISNFFDMSRKARAQTNGKCDGRGGEVDGVDVAATLRYFWMTPDGMWRRRSCAEE